MLWQVWCSVQTNVGIRLAELIIRIRKINPDQNGSELATLLPNTKNPFNSNTKLTPYWQCYFTPPPLDAGGLWLKNCASLPKNVPEGSRGEMCSWKSQARIYTRDLLTDNKLTKNIAIMLVVVVMVVIVMSILFRLCCLLLLFFLLLHGHVGLQDVAGIRYEVLMQETTIKL